MNDKGRALDRLFFSDRAAIITEVVLSAIRAFDLQIKRIHNDSTSVTLFGDYAQYKDTKAAKPKLGHNKDHRPDLKQLRLFDSGDTKIFADLFGKYITNFGMPGYCEASILFRILPPRMVAPPLEPIRNRFSVDASEADFASYNKRFFSVRPRSCAQRIFAVGIEWIEKTS